MKTLRSLRSTYAAPLAFIAAATGSVAISSASAQLIQDNFLTGGAPNYSIGVISNQNPTVTGWTGPWVAGSTTAASVTNINLSFSNASGSVATDGGSVYIGSGLNVAGRVWRNLSSPIDVNSNSTVFMSFMMQNTLASSTNQYRAFELNITNATGSDSTRVFQLGLGQADFGSSNNYGFRLNNSASLVGNLGAADTNVNFFVVKMVLSSTAGSDSVTVWRNPTDLSSELLSGSGVGFTNVTLANNIGRVQLAGFNAGETYYDAMRIGSSWTDVTTIPEPSTVALLATGLTAAVLLRLRRRSSSSQTKN